MEHVCDARAYAPQLVLGRLRKSTQCFNQDTFCGVLLFQMQMRAIAAHRHAVLWLHILQLSAFVHLDVTGQTPDAIYPSIEHLSLSC